MEAWLNSEHPEQFHQVRENQVKVYMPSFWNLRFTFSIITLVNFIYYFNIGSIALLACFSTTGIIIIFCCSCSLQWWKHLCYFPSVVSTFNYFQSLTDSLSFWSTTLSLFYFTFYLSNVDHEHHQMLEVVNFIMHIKPLIKRAGCVLERCCCYHWFYICWWFIGKRKPQ